jgi:uncharacterized protein
MFKFQRISQLFLLGTLLASSACGQTKPVADDGLWPKLKAIYDYDAKGAVEVKSTPVENTDMRMERITFTGPEGDAASGFFSRPKADGVYPCVLLLHGLGDSSKGRFDLGMAKAFTEQGIAVLALDAPHHGPRMSQQDMMLFLKMGQDITTAKTQGDLAAQIKEVDKDRAIEKVLAETIRQGVKDYRRALDWLSSRKDIKADRIGAMGYSLGSIMSSILGGVDTRVRSIALCVGGDATVGYSATEPAETKERALAISPSLYISHMAGRPILFLNGKTDQIIPKKATDLLYEAARDPKEIRWFESGHSLPQDALAQAVKWTVAELKGK